MVSMKYIHYLIGMFVLLSMFVSPVYGTETNALIHYSEIEAEIQDEFTLEQGYSFKVLDINEKSGSCWIGVYLNGEEVEVDDPFGKETDPFEYIKTIIENEDEDDEEEIDFLVIRITPTEVIEELLTVELEVNQFVDPEIEATEYLLLDKKRSVDVGTTLELEDGYTLDASNLKDDSVMLTLSKNDSPVKKEEVEVGDLFTYSKTIGGKTITIFISKVKSIFEGADSDVIFLEQVSQREDIVVQTDVGITVEGPNGGKIREGNIAIIRYAIDNGDISKVQVLLDGKQIDQRSDVDAGTYSTVAESLEAGTHEVIVTTVAGDGTRSTHTKTFEVESSIASEAAETAAQIAAEAAASAVENLIDENKTSPEIQKIVEELKAPGFGSVMSVVVIALAVLVRRRG